jgi:hypothetical protein
MIDLSRISIVGILKHGTCKDVWMHNHRKSVEDIN